MGNQPGVSKTRQRMNQYPQGYGRSGRVSPYTGQSPIPSAGVIGQTQSPLMRGRVINSANMGRSNMGQKSINNSYMAEKSPNRPISLSPSISQRRLSPEHSYRETPESRGVSYGNYNNEGRGASYGGSNNNDAVSQALSRVLGGNYSNQGYTGSRGSNYDNDIPKHSYRPDTSKDYSRESRDYGRDYTPPRANIANTITAPTRFERRFTDKELAKLKLDFSLISKNDSIIRDKLVEYLGLDEIGHTLLIDRLIDVLQNVLGGYGERGTGKGFNYEKFVQAVGVLCKGEVNERLDLIYRLFDLYGQGFITKDEFSGVYTQYFHAMMSVNFQQNPLSQLRSQLQNIDENQLADMMDEYIDEIYTNWAMDTNRMQQNEWKKWFSSQPDMMDVLNVKVELIS